MEVDPVIIVYQNYSYIVLKLNIDDHDKISNKKTFDSHKKVYLQN